LKIENSKYEKMLLIFILTAITNIFTEIKVPRFRDGMLMSVLSLEPVARHVCNVLAFVVEER
jgi:hypothetical protein